MFREINVRPSEDDRGRLNSFLIKAVGGSKYLISEEFQDWFYSSGFGKTWLVMSDKNEVMSMLNVIEPLKRDRRANINVCFNFVTDKAHSGSGLLLLTKIRRSRNFYIPGVLGPLSETYSYFGTKKFNYFWGYRILVPHLRLRMIKNMIFGVAPTLPSIKVALDGYSITNIISEQEITNLGSFVKDFDQEFLKWRLESIDKRRCIIAKHPISNSIVVGSIGVRKGLLILRIFFIKGEISHVQILISRLHKLAAEMGILASFVVTDNSVGNSLEANGMFRSRSKIPDSHIAFDGGHIDNEAMLIASDVGIQEQWSK